MALLKTMGLDLGGMRRPQANLSPEAVTKLVASPSLFFVIPSDSLP